MCIIIDANVAHKFDQPPHQDMGPVVSWLQHRKHLNQAVIGGQLRRELHKAGEAIRRFLVQLKRNGRLFEVPDDTVDAETLEVRKLLAEAAIEDADDPHILALARLSGSRLLISHDFASRLHELFKTRRFLDPPGKVYQKASKSHKKLLWAAPPCERRKS
jgi:hypothetical protein